MGIGRQVVVVPHAAELGEGDEADKCEARGRCTQAIRDHAQQVVEESR